MNTLIILTVIIAIVTVIYMTTVKKKVTTRINHLNNPPVTAQSYNRTAPLFTPEDWRQKFQEAGLSQHWQKFEPLLRSEIAIKPENAVDTEINVGQSKIGGQPDLPKNQTWFKENSGKSLSFLAQINLSETSQLDKLNQLPSSGLLYFFYSAEQEAWGFDPKDKDKFKVFYFNGDVADLARTEFPSDLPEYSRYKTCKISFDSSVSIPDCESEVVFEILSDKEQDAYIKLTVDGEITKLLGHSDNIQGTMEEECQLVTNGLYCGDASGYNDPRAVALKKVADKWILLFQIDSIDKAGMMWGDVGRVYFWIKREDLEKKDFNKSWVVLQCS
ncbi:MAG: DUF1963 domain-containing protein [Bacteroidetes bacterium]|nr:DUF1963 domain-containing protein [Bacteroidota bacterium]